MTTTTGPKTTGELGTAIAVLQAGMAAFRSYESGDRTFTSALSLAEVFIRELCDKGVTLEDLLNIMQFAPTLVAINPPRKVGRPRKSAKTAPKKSGRRRERQPGLPGATAATAETPAS